MKTPESADCSKKSKNKKDVVEGEGRGKLLLIIYFFLSLLFLAVAPNKR